MYEINSIMPMSNDEEKLRVELIEETLSGGLMSGYNESGFPFYFIGNAMLKHLGYKSKEDFVADIDGLINNCIHPDDLKAVEKNVASQLESKGRYEIEYRIQKADKSYIWVRDYGKITRLSNGRQVINSILYDITEQVKVKQRDAKHYSQLEATQNALMESRDTMYAAIGAAQIMYFEYFPEGDYALEHNGREHFNVDERLDNYPQSWFDKKITHPDDEHILKEAFVNLKNGAEKASCTVRNIIGGKYHWHHYNFTSIYDKSGVRTKVVCTAQDITEEKNAQQLNADYKRLYNRTPGWIFTCQNNESWTLKHTNGHIFDATGYTADEFAKEKNNSIASIIPTSYHDMIKSEIAAMEKNGLGSKTTYDVPVTHKNGSYTWHKVDLYLDETNGEKFLYVSCSDITTIRATQDEINESNRRYHLTTKYANINVWTYDLVNDIIYNGHDANVPHPGERIQTDFLQKVISNNFIRTDSQPAFFKMFSDLKNGCETVSGDFWISKPDGTGYWCERITQVLVLDENGKPSKAFGIGRDVTEFKEAELRIEEENRLHEEMENDKILLKTRANVTLDVVESIQTKSAMTVPNRATTFTGGVEQMAQNAYTENDRQLIYSMLSASRIEQALKESTTYSFEYQRNNVKRHAIWVRVNVRVLCEPDSHDTIAFIHIVDINSEKQQEMIINRIAQTDYEVLALIYTQTDEIEPIQLNNAGKNISIDYSLPYSIGMHRLLDKYLNDADKEEVYDKFTVEHIKSVLNEQAVYEISYSMRDEDIYQKKWEFTYLDDAKTTIIFSRTDITQLFREQEMQKENLHNALLQAEEASKAKTNFLSRMSHEIRTPMNAIIGMNTLALQAVNNPEQVSECLSKIGISARFLLSLINDILDMSRIESGKVTVKQSKFPFEELVNSINSIFYEQAEQKGIDYDCVISSFVSDYYIGDAMKIQQVIVNLLGNAIKFTEKGGKIQLIINQERTANDKAYMSFSVNDTGIGIDSELQKTMFEPFEQGDVTLTTPYKGTGLGLAISKNLINMMNGTINVHSIKGIGSEFIVRIPLGICDDEKNYHDLKLDIAVEKLSTLIVDDDITICEHTQALLEEVGMKAQWVESGIKAVELIKRKWNELEGHFDVVLLDWKMPDMDGIETAKEIRKIVGDDVTIIVMTAYDWAEIEHEAKQAGVNMLVTKPLFKSSLISVFENAFKQNDKNKPKPQQVEFDFTGRHILLVEDHILNVEVAKRLLEAKHAEVTVANNGLHAIEQFMSAEDNYFDAILMDIRMPVMDGLTATKSIRQLHRAYAKTVPIIAMSANAFDDDIDKSKTSGMNEHLSKPIDPQLMYSTIQKWIEK